MIWVIGGTALTVLMAVYVTVLRPLMRSTPWGQSFLSKIEPFERVFYWKSETILWSRFKTALGSLLSVLVLVDWNSLSPIIPEKYRPLLLMLPTLFVTIDGLIGEKMRRDTSKPLEVVAMRTDAPVEVQVAAAVAEENMKQVVAEVKAAEVVRSS